ncbi:MAG: M61 family metallopeptidase [Candidatus Acidiferrales bacterium]
MSHRCRRAIALASLLLSFALPPTAHSQSRAGAAAAAPLRYELRFDKPNSHLLDITIRATGLRGPAVEFAMPAWSPGSYEINNYAKMVQDFSASAADGKPLLWRKTDKHTWRVELGRAREVAVRYKLYGNTLSHHWVHYSDQHAFISGPAAWMYMVDGKQRPIVLTIDTPATWRVATSLTRTAANTFAADDYDWLADSPIEISNHTEQTFTHAGTTYRFVVHDILGKSDFSKAVQDTQKIVEAIVPWFAGVEPDGRATPFEEYVFLFHIWPRVGSGGLEHLNSTQITFGSTWENEGFAGRYGTDYQLKLFVIAHEFYHAWSVKRLRPKELGPFDYSQEVYTPSLWIAEGVTSYYGQLALVRAGLLSVDDYLASVGALITEVENMPGRKERSIAESSWDAWFEGNPPGDTNLPNTNHSYYDTGQIMGHALDFAIRHHTGNQKSLDDWMRLLYRRHALPRPGFTPEEAVKAASEVAGRDMNEFFRRHVTGKEPPPYEELFGYAGIEVQKTTQPGNPWLGVSFTRDLNGYAEIYNVLPNSPAMEAGLDREDVVTELDGKAVKVDQLVQALSAKKPGDRVRIKVRRLREMRAFEATLGADPTVTYTLKPLANPTPEQKRTYESWLGMR